MLCSTLQNSPQMKRLMKYISQQIRSLERTATKMVKGLEVKTWGAAEVPLFVQPRAEELRGGLMAAGAPHREQRGSAELCSL